MNKEFWITLHGHKLLCYKDHDGDILFTVPGVAFDGDGFGRNTTICFNVRAVGGADTRDIRLDITDEYGAPLTATCDGDKLKGWGKADANKTKIISGVSVPGYLFEAILEWCKDRKRSAVANTSATAPRVMSDYMSETDDPPAGPPLMCKRYDPVPPIICAVLTGYIAMVVCAVLS